MKLGSDRDMFDDYSSGNFIANISTSSKTPQDITSRLLTVSKTCVSLPNNAKLVSEVTTNSEEEVQNKRYKEKCCRLQKQVRHVIYMNGAIQSELSQCLTKLSEASEERRFLLNKILRYHKDVNHENTSSRILQEALSKKQTTKHSVTSSASHNSCPAPLFSSLTNSFQSLPQTDCNLTTDSELMLLS